MVAHGLITGMLFFVAGSVKERYHTLEIKRLSGMLQQMPQAGLDPRLLRDGLARPARPRRLLGRVPGDPQRRGARPRCSSTTVSESLFRVLTVIAALGTVLAAGYLLWLYQRTAFGEPTAEFAGAATATRARRSRSRRCRRRPSQRHPRRDRRSSGSRGRRC